MDKRTAVFLISFLVLSFSRALPLTHAAVPPEWQYSQDLQPVKAGLVRVKLPMETISSAQASLADLRVVDAAAREVPYIIDQPSVVPAQNRPLEQIQQTMEKGRTVITGRIPNDLLKQGVDAIFLYTATDDFLKAITIESSNDGKAWAPLVRSAPVFKQPGMMSGSSRLSFAAVKAPLLRITLDDALTPPIRVQSVNIFAAAQPLAGLDSVTPIMTTAQANERQSEIVLTFPADHLWINQLHFGMPERTFRRHVTAIAKVFVDGEFREQVLGDGWIYRVPLNAKEAAELTLPLNQPLPGRQLILRIDNGDSRPLTLTAMKADIVPATLVFDAPTAGVYSLLSGHPGATAPGYDVSALRDALAQAPAQTAVLGNPTVNPAFQTAEPLPQVSEGGSDIDTGPWGYRKKVQLGEPGIQRLELDLETLSHNKNRTPALRLVREGQQIPYVLDAVGVERSISPTLDVFPAKEHQSAWTITFPNAQLPIAALRFTVLEPLFQRSVTLYEETTDERGEPVRQVLSQGVWVRTSGESREGFTLPLYRAPASARLILEMDHGDNAPIHVQTVQAYYRTPRLLFKAAPGNDLFLYYGQDEAAAPHYDLSLVSHELLNAVPQEVTLLKEEVLKARPWWEAPVPTGGLRYAFWAVLVLVVGGLLFVIARLLPEESAS